MNNIRVFNSDVYWIDTTAWTTRLFVTNSLIFNNRGTAINFYGINIATIHNSHIFNNNRAAYLDQNAQHITFSNSQLYNNDSMLVENSYGWPITFFNSLLYNNNNISLDQSNFGYSLFNTSIYNNNNVYISGPIPVYGLMKIFENWSNPGDDYPFTGSDYFDLTQISPVAGRTTWSVQTGLSMNSGYHTNATDSSGTLLHAWDSSIRGRDSNRIPVFPISFSYTTGRTLQQLNPLAYNSGNQLYYPGIVYSTGSFIGQPFFGFQSQWGGGQCLNGIGTITFEWFGFCLQSAGTEANVLITDTASNTTLPNAIINTPGVYRLPFRVAPTSNNSTSTQTRYAGVPINIPAMSSWTINTGSIYIRTFKSVEVILWGGIKALYE
jgi:hypothetical protein